jgi:hypothetical protein
MTIEPQPATGAKDRARNRRVMMFMGKRITRSGDRFVSFTALSRD